MDTPLIIDEKDPKWTLLGKILATVASRRVKQEMAKHGIVPVNMAGVMLKVVLIAMFFGVDISYVVEELNNRIELRRFARVGEIPEAKKIYRFTSRFREKQFVGLISGTLSTICVKRRRNRVILVDSTDISLDLNWLRKKIKKADLEEREFKWGYSSSKGYYIGYKLTLAIEYPSLRPVAFLVHQGSPSDAKIYEKILEELKKRRVARNGDKIIFDRGYYSYKNYVMGISKFKIVPGIFPRKNLKRGKLRSMLTYSLSIFDRPHPEKEKNFFNRLAKDLINIIDNWEEYRPIRGMIEDIFKLAKNAFSLRKLHRYTERSVGKIICLNVLLVGVVVSLGFNSKEELQRMAEW
jgi:hypothetical protein